MKRKASTKKGKTLEQLYGIEKATNITEKMREAAQKRTGERNSFYQKHHSEETKKKISEAKKGKPSKLKGLSLEERLGEQRAIKIKANLSLLNKGKKLSEEVCVKISEGHKGIKYAPRSEEHKRKISENKKAYFRNGGKPHIPSEKERKQISERMKNRIVTQQTRNKQSQANEGKLLGLDNPMSDPQIKLKHLAAVNTPEYKAKMSNIVKERYQNPQYKQKSINAILKGMFKRPTSLEQAFIAFFKKYNLPYTYVGNGAVIIGMKNPDFVNLEEKICIEVRPKETCKIWSKCTPEEYELRQVTHYSKYYWNCVVLWKEMLENEQSILDKIAKIRSEDVFLPKCSLTAQ